MITLCLLLSEKDAHLLPSWFNANDHFGRVIIGIDGNVDLSIFDEMSHVTVFNLQLNNDFAGARNTIMDMVSSEYALWLDADELLIPPVKNIENAASMLTQHGAKVGQALRLNVFERTFVDFPNYHSILLHKSVRYQNSSGGAHEVPDDVGVVLPVQILHLKEQWINFRSKGFADENQGAALTDLQRKILELHNKYDSYKSME